MIKFFFLSFFTGLLYLICGFLYKYYPPKKYKGWSYGVKFPFAKRNMEVWKEANRFIAVPMMFLGLFFIVYGLYVFFINGYAPAAHEFFILFISLNGALIGLTKRHLNKLFDQNAKRKTERDLR